jgi:hypothetical protein
LHLINDACVVALVVWFWMPIVTRVCWLVKEKSPEGVRYVANCHTDPDPRSDSYPRSSKSLADAVAIADGKILATGSHDRIMSFAADGTQIIDQIPAW